MKKIFFSVITVAFSCISLTAASQQTFQQSSIPTNQPVSLQTTEGKRAQNFFVELLGQGIWVTANYDTRFGNRREGLGGRVGVGLGPSFNFDFWDTEVEEKAPLLVPVSLNYLLGNGGKHFFEIGLGATFISGDGGGIVGTTSFSYRLQPLNNGFTLRAGLNPILSDGEFFPLFGGVSLGYTF